jgi:hypothetical protein
MIRRKFTQSLVSVLGLSSLSLGVSSTLSFSNQKVKTYLDENKTLITEEGLQLNLYSHNYATQNKDEKQFVLTYDVKNGQVLEEKIYHVLNSKGDSSLLFLTPINNKLLRAIFNWRIDV